MKIIYNVKIQTNDGKSHTFQWSCRRTAMHEMEDVVDKFFSHSSFIVKETETTTCVVPRSAICKVDFTIAKDPAEY